MKNFKKNKKGITEIVSFSLIFIIIVLASIVAYYLVKNETAKFLAKQDYNKFKTELKYLRYSINNLEEFNNSIMTIPITINKGALIFYKNQIYFYSEKKNYNNYHFCFPSYCEITENGFAVLYTNLTNNFNFNEEKILYSGNYLIKLRSNLNKKIIYISLRNYK